jgi:hypothetical protein
VCAAALNCWCKLQELTSVYEYGGGVCKPNVTHVTLSTRYVREWGTWPARDARTANPNFVRFKTWGLGLRTGDFGDWGLDQGTTALASLRTLPSTPPSHHCHLHCLSLSLSHPTTPQRSRMKHIMSHIHQEPSCGRTGVWRVGGRIAPSSSGLVTLSTHTR